ncbi:MAG: galactokinase [Flavobacteriaceae bacterium]|nr:MAG: galactokinase [Flavobacteriaceae bacterium]
MLPQNEKLRAYNEFFTPEESDIIIEAPGRINLIGEHIDYNGGHVLPAAINRKITIRLKKNGHENICTIFSSSYNCKFDLDLHNIKKSNVLWENYILGVIHFIHLLKPNSLLGFDCIIDSDLPMGAGISSSAAFECGFAAGLNNLFNLELTDIEIITVSQSAEQTFVGTNCGIMDQFSVVKGRKNKLIFLNCNTLDFKYINADFDPYNIILLNTNVSHTLSESEYNTRRDECKIVLDLINKNGNQFECLADVPKQILMLYKNSMSKKEYDRALYVVQENNRVIKATQALENNNMEAFGKLLYQSHLGLKNLYEVSCVELDFLVDYSTKHKEVIGSRMMGGGFGGSTVNLIHKDYVNSYIENVSKAYKEEFSISLTPIIVSVDNGVAIKKHNIQQ